MLANSMALPCCGSAVGVRGTRQAKNVLCGPYRKKVLEAVCACVPTSQCGMSVHLDGVFDERSRALVIGNLIAHHDREEGQRGDGKGSDDLEYDAVLSHAKVGVESRGPDAPHQCKKDAPVVVLRAVAYSWSRGGVTAIGLAASGIG